MFAPMYVLAHAHMIVRIYIVMRNVDYYSCKCEYVLKLKLF